MFVILLLLQIATLEAFTFTSPLSSIYKTPLIATSLNERNDNDNDNERIPQPWTNEGGRVFVRVERTFPHISTPTEALEGWMEHHWNRGGGLPIGVVIQPTDTTQKDNVAIRSTRMLYPLFMEEELYSSKLADKTSVSYTVTSAGPTLGDMVPQSHEGDVLFESTGTGKGIHMTWDVSFDTTRLTSFYQAVTEFTIGVAATTVTDALALPRLLTLRGTIPGTSKQTLSPQSVRAEWLAFIWGKGGGLPLPPAVPTGEFLDLSVCLAGVKESVFRFPPFMTETIISTSTGDSQGDAQGAAECVDLVFRIEDPGWSSFPFAVHTHLSKVEFSKNTKPTSTSTLDNDNQNNVDILWKIQIRSFPFMASIVEPLCTAVASTLLRNLAVHIAEPGAVVSLKGTSFVINTDASDAATSGLLGVLQDAATGMRGVVPKNTWMGGVLEARRRDERTGGEQWVDLLQPWTWGRSGNGVVDEDEVTFIWSDGCIDE